MKNLNWINQWNFSIFERAYRRIQARSIRQLFRTALFRFKPSAWIAHNYYRRFSVSRSGRRRINARSLRDFSRNSPQLNDSQQKALKSLVQDGIYTDNVRRFLSDKMLFNRVMADAKKLIANKHIQRQIYHRHSLEGIKWYVIRAFGYRPNRLVPTSFIELAAHDGMLAVVNSYFGLHCRLIYLDVWYNFPVDEGEPAIASESFHRDNEDLNLLKLYVYLSDVGEKEGPLTYVLGSQPSGPLGHVFPAFPPIGSYPPDSSLHCHISEATIRRCTGTTGTMVLFDALGLHCGGRATRHPRLLFVATYASNAAFDKLKYTLYNSMKIKQLSPQAKYALHIEEN